MKPKIRMWPLYSKLNEQSLKNVSHFAHLEVAMDSYFNFIQNVKWEHAEIDRITQISYKIVYFEGVI